MWEDARAELDEIRRRGLDELRPALWLASLTYLTDASYAVGDARMAAELYAALETYAGGIVAVGHGVVCYGSVDRYLGMAAATAGDADAARAHFEVAMEVNSRMHARTWLAHTAYVYGRLLLPQDPERAHELLRTASTLASQVGMPTLIARIAAVGAPITASPLPDDLSPRELQILGQVAQGLSNREIGSDARGQRAHRGEPCPQHPAQDRLRQPHRGRCLRSSARPRAGRGGGSRMLVRCRSI